MKTAICISGIPRCWDKFPKHLFHGDCFIHTWNVTFNEGCYTKFPFEVVRKWSDFNQISQHFDPVNMIVEEYDENTAEKFKSQSDIHIDGTRRRSVYPMYYSVMRSIEMVPPEYTHIIRCRFDTRTDTQICPTDGFWIPSNGDFYGINDQFAYGDYSVMKHYGNTYLSIPSQYELNPEKILKYQMQNLKINRIDGKFWLDRDHN